MKNPYYQGPVSDHFDGNRFFNPDGVEPGGLAALLKWRLNNKRVAWPKMVPNPLPPARPETRINGNGLRVTAIGHASMLVQVAGLNILLDPVYSERVSPFTFIGPKRVAAAGVRFEDLPPIDLVLISHNHYDHLDIETVKRLEKQHRPAFVTPFGNDTLIKQAAPAAQILPLDWGTQVPVRDDVTIHAEPAHHWSARGIRDRRMALWAAFVIATPAGRIYHIGDTGFHGGRNYEAAGKKYGSFRLAILPVGAYEPRFFMAGQHQDPREAVEGMQLCNAAFAVGHHFGTVQLTDEGIDAPIRDLADALQKSHVPEERFRPLQPGEVWDVPVEGEKALGLETTG